MFTYEICFTSMHPKNILYEGTQEADNSVSTSQVHSEMNENCIYNVRKEKVYPLSSRAMCSRCIFFSPISVLGWVRSPTEDRQDGF